VSSIEKLTDEEREAVRRGAWVSGRNALQAKLTKLETVLKRPGAWSEWARECLAVLGGVK
jgi:hypothetical protein